MAKDYSEGKTTTWMPITLVDRLEKLKKVSQEPLYSVIERVLNTSSLEARR